MPTERRAGRFVICARCRRERRNVGRHLCRSCYTTAERQGALIDYPRKTMDAEAMLEGWELCVAEFEPGKCQRDAAERIGVSLRALAKALERGRERGDERAFLKLRKLPPLPVPRDWRRARPRRTMPA